MSRARGVRRTGFFSDEGGESTLNSELEPLLRMNELDIDSLTVV
eukprot:COSAG06_NODE_30154_length_543_cov_10.567568_2_plen_43_part_01